jgi:anion-transporting  ArsA/GET3 family ATPase
MENHMSHLHFIGGEKGGVGKSLVARILAQYFIDRRQSFTVSTAPAPSLIFQM